MICSYIIFENQLAFLVGTFSQTGQLLKRPVVACCKPSWAFSERSHLWLLRPTDLRLDGSSRIVKIMLALFSYAFVDEFTFEFGSCVLPSFQLDRYLRIFAPVCNTLSNHDEKTLYP